MLSQAPMQPCFGWIKFVLTLFVEGYSGNIPVKIGEGIEGVVI